MAEIISIRVNVSDSDYKRTTGRLLEIQKYVDTLNKTPIHIKIDDTGFEKATKQITAYNNSVARMVKAENELAVAKEKTAQAQAKAEAEAWKAEQQETRLATAQVNRHTQTIRQQTEIIKGENQIALQKEKTATVVARTAQEEAKANTALVQGQARLAVQQEKTATAAARAEAAQRGENAAMQEGSAASSLLNNSLGSLVLQYVSIRMIISKVVSAFRDALNTMKEVDSELVTIQKTTGYSGEQLDRLTDSAYKLASAYGRTATEILNAASVYARAGFKENLEDMTELSALLQNVGDLTGEAAAKTLVATNAAWQMNGSYEALLRVIDGLNQQTNEAAVDMNALTSGITVAGSVFSNAGESVQTFAGLLGAGVALTQRSGSEIGRGLRTIAMNIRQIKGELDDGEIIDEASISDAAAALHSVGISVADANGELRLTSDVLTDLAAKWGSLTTAEQSYLSQSLAGKRQANILNALMNNWQEVERQMTLYANGAGSAMKENEIYLDSWEAKTKQLDAAWTEFVANLVDTDLVKRALDGLIAIVNMLDSDFGHFLVTATAITTGLLTLGTVLSKLQAAFALLGATMAPLLGVAAVGVGVAGLIALSDALTTSSQEYADAVKEAENAYERTKTQLEDLKKRENELTDIERNKLAILKEQAETQAGNLKEAKKDQYNHLYGNQNAYQTATDLINQYNAYKQRLETTTDAAEFEKLEKGLDNVYSKIQTTLSGLIDFQQVLIEDFPHSGDEAIRVLQGFIDNLEAEQLATKHASEEWLEAGRRAFSWMQQNNNAANSIQTLEERLKAVSEKATSYDVVIAAVISAMADFGAESYEVNQAMKNLEQIIPGSTAKMYDFDTATVITEEDIWGSKEALLNFIDTQKQIEFSEQINELEKLANGYLDVAEAALAAMVNQQAQAQMSGVLAFTTGGVGGATYGADLANANKAKAEWDSYVATLRSRSSYKPDTSSGGRGSYTPVSTAPENTKDTELERLKAIVNLEKAELSFLQASGKSLDEINAKRKVIQAALHDEAEYLRAQLEILKAEEVAEEDKAEHEAKIKALEEEILGLSTEWWNIQKNINDDLAKAEEERKKQLEEEAKLLEEQKKLQQEMFDNLKSIVDDYYAKLIEDKEKELTLEERILAVQQAEAALANAQRERTVRYYNAATGQWEWQANAKNVKSAQDALKKAQDDLNKYQREQAWKEFKSAWEYVSEQIKAGAMTFQEAYDYMYEAMKRIQDTYGVDLGFVLDDSIGGFKNLNYGIDGLTQEVANSLGASVGVLNEKLKQYETAVGAFKDAFDDAAEKVKNGEWSMEDAYSYLRDRAKEIADKYGIDMTGALEEAIAGMDKTNMSIDELWKAVIINLMKVNSARWFDASDEEKALLHAQNEYLGRLIGATYDPSGYWYLNGSQLYGSQKGVDYSGKTTGYGSFTGSGGGYGGGGGGSSGGAASGGYDVITQPDGTRKYKLYDGTEYETLEDAIAANAAKSIYNNGGDNKARYYGKAWETIYNNQQRWKDPDAWAEYSKLLEADPEYADALRKLEEAVKNGASQSEVTAMVNALYSGENGSFGSIKGDVTTGWVKAGYGNANGEHLLILNGELYQTGVNPGTMLQDLWGNRWEVGEDGKTLTPIESAWDQNMMSLANSDLGVSGSSMYDTPELPASAGAVTTTTTNNTSGDTYNINGVKISESDARSMTVADLAKLAGGLGKFNGTAR
jgi:TP901 family phage tail tape measure protein